MVVIEIPPNANCEPVDMRLFNDVEGPSRVRQLYVAPDGGSPAWHEITGWTVEGLICPALARHVDDSGEGLAILISGGTAGLRLRPAGSSGPWGSNKHEWGLPFLLTTDAQDLRCEAMTDG